MFRVFSTAANRLHTAPTPFICAALKPFVRAGSTIRSPPPGSAALSTDCPTAPPRPTMKNAKNPALVSADWLRERLSTATVSGGLRVLDCSWYLSSPHEQGLAEFTASRIPSAVFYDIEAIKDRQSTQPHILPPTAEAFAALVAEHLGVRETDDLVLYHRGPWPTSFRAWFSFAVHGHRGDISIVNGGLESWIAAGGATESGPRPTVVPSVYHATRLDSLIPFEKVVENVESKEFVVIDARSNERFTASVPETRPGLRGGHVPGARNIPFSRFFDGQSTKFIEDPEKLKSIYANAGVNLESDKIVNMCGSGVTACVSQFALVALLGVPARLYNGSWTEYGGKPDAPIEK